MSLDKIPTIDMSSENFKEELAFNIWSTHSSSDYRNDRERPYNGQEHTDDGERGKTEVKGLTMRDIRDCLVKAILLSSPSDQYLKGDVFTKCWDYSEYDTTGKAKPTEYLLSRQNEPDFISTKVDTNTWRTQDVFKVNFNSIDPLAVAQNLTCEIEKMMGIFPNI